MKVFLFAFLLLYTSSQIKAQQVLIVNPSSDTSSMVASPFPNTITNNAVNLVAAYWTANGQPGAWRNYFKMGFDLPINSVVDSAYFSLYADNLSTWGNPGNPNFGVQNNAQICRVTSPWYNNILWGNIPSFNPNNAAIISQSSSTIQDYPKIDAKQLIQDVINSGFNYGFLLKLSNEVNTYNSQIFHSTSTPDESKRPKLTIYYHLPPSNLSDNSMENQLQLLQSATSLNFINTYGIGIRELEIVNTQGQTMLSEKFSHNSDFAIELPKSLPQGLYIVRVLTSRGVFAKKIIIN